VKSEAAASVVASLLTPPVADRPNCPRVPAPGQPRKLVLSGTLAHARGTPIVHRSRIGQSTDFIALFERLDPLCGPRPGQTRRRNRQPVRRLFKQADTPTNSMRYPAGFAKL
jgi:hypothetical protein